ncbi:hypothetical protein [uncultured Intestinimonas sp.]|uniref:hypothetical protein n=1 Tax=uncultured Intestinimonas sp. TaxID=1689265 RepID=UPI002943B26E|nr:hypothetical protein [uncultured Intestinimonas sp.]
MRGRTSYAGRLALSALLTALSLVILWGAAMAPWGRMGLVALAGLTPAAAVISGGPAAGGLCWAGTGILALLLLPDKGCGLLYLLFFGLYPLVKYAAERLSRRPLELLVKLAFFNAALTVLWFGLRAVFLWGLPQAEGLGWLLYPVGNGIFLAYDYGFSRLIAFYIARVDRPLRRGRGA